MEKEIKIWYDKEGDYLEVIFERKAGYFRETENDAGMEQVDNKGNIRGVTMKKDVILKLHSDFESMVQIETETGTEFWFARV